MKKAAGIQFKFSHPNCHWLSLLDVLVKMTVRNSFTGNLVGNHWSKTIPT